MADRSAGYKVFRKYKGVLESHVDKKFNEIVNGFYNEQILTEEQKTEALDTNEKRSVRISNLKKIMREKCQENDTAFEAILRTFRLIEGIDVKKIITDFEAEKKNLASKHKSKYSESSSKRAESITLSTNPVSPQNYPEPAPNRGKELIEAPPPSFIDHFPRSGNLSTMPDSPNVNTQPDSEDDDQFLIKQETASPNREVVVVPDLQSSNKTLTHQPPLAHSYSMIENEVDTEKKQIDRLIKSIAEVRDTPVELQAKVTTIQEKFTKLTTFYCESDKHFDRVQTESKRLNVQLSEQIECFKSNIQDMQDEWDYDKQCADDEIQSLGDSWQKESFQNVLKQEEVEELRKQLKEKKAKIEKLTHELQEEKSDVRKINYKLRDRFTKERNETLEMIKRKLSSCVTAETEEKADEMFKDIELILLRLKGRPCTTGGARSIRQ